jgi:hypothetical protein
MKAIRLLVVSAIAMMLIACASKPYVINTVINETAKTKTETICTHKIYVIPWYIGVAAGFVKFNGEKDCHDETTVLDDRGGGQNL